MAARRRKSNPASIVVLAVIGVIWLFATYPAAGMALFFLAGLVAFGISNEKKKAARRKIDEQVAYTLNKLDELSGAEFESWVTAVLQDAGIGAENIRDRGDFGVDVIATVGSTRIGIQVKRYAKSVGNSAVQEALAGSGYHDCSLAAVVTQSKFTRAAKKQAARARVRVLLVDRSNVHELARLVREFARG